MRRRQFITLVGSAAAAWPLAARAQQASGIRRIGVLLGSAEGDSQTHAALAAFTKALQELGWTDGRNIRIETRWAAADTDRMRSLAKELVGLQPDLIVGHTTPVVAALQRETATIPIVFVLVSDPVGSRFVASLPRPGNNITGFINLESSLGGKWIEILRDILPRAKRAMLMFNPETATYHYYYWQPFEAAARSQSIEPIAAPIHDAADIEHVISGASHRDNSGLVVMPDIFTTTRRSLDLIVSLAASHRLPTIYSYQFMVAAGGLISYGVDNIDIYRRSTAYVDRILRGTKPADLPVQLPTRFEFAVNLKTAKGPGLDIPAMLLGRADEVIE